MIVSCCGLLALAASEPLTYVPHIIDATLPGRYYGQTALADLDRDGRLEYIVGRKGGDVYWYHCDAPDRWTRHLLGHDSPSDVGGAAMDVDGDGWIDFVTGGAWYRNARDPGRPFERFVFDAAPLKTHDVAVADIDGDGRLEILLMSDQVDLRWYRIPEDPREPWTHTVIGRGVHAGLAVGDLDGDGDIDVVRTDVWFENANGDGTVWVEHPIGPCSPPPEDFRPYFAYNATRAKVVDMNGDGRNDIVFTDGEIPGGKIWWMENADGDGRRWVRHEVPQAEGPRRGAYHSLWVGDFDGDGDFDIVSAEMEAVRGVNPPRWYWWENLDGRGGEWREHVLLDANLGGHEIVVGDILGDGRLGILGKPWEASAQNALDGKMFVVYLEPPAR